jgi:hypothetical protein
MNDTPNTEPACLCGEAPEAECHESPDGGCSCRFDRHIYGCHYLAWVEYEAAQASTGGDA